MEILFVLIPAGIALSLIITFNNYKLYTSVFFNKRPIYSSITNKVWFRALIVPFIYLPGLNIFGLLILLYIKAMKTLYIN